MTYQLGWAVEGFSTFLAALVTAGGSYEKYDWTTGEDERHTARTSDGWDLGLYRYRARGARKLVAQHLLAVCYYAKNHPEDPAFAPWVQMLQGDGFCRSSQVATPLEIGRAHV